MPVLFLLKRPATIRRNPECSLLCGGTTSPSSPPFPLRDAGEPSDEKMPAIATSIRPSMQLQCRKRVPTRESRGRLAPQQQFSQCGHNVDGRTAAFCTQAGRPILFAKLQGCNASWVRSGRQFKNQEARSVALALLPSLRRCFSRLEW